MDFNQSIKLENKIKKIAGIKQLPAIFVFANPANQWD
jgi:hypothetical protein